MRAYPAFLDIDLGSEQGRALLSSVEDRHGAPIVRAASIAKRMFILRSPWAPGLHFIGGETHARSPEGDGGADVVFSLSGAGETLEDAFASCIGEGVDRLAQIECRGDVTTTASLQDVEARVLPSAISAIDQELVDRVLPRTTPIAWVEGNTLSVTDPLGLGKSVLLPADWCLRRVPDKIALRPRTALSVGVAAGPNFEWAAQRALLELIERDAASLWWIGGRRGHSVALDHPAMTDIVRLLGVLRHGVCERHTWLLDITTDIGIPALAAISCGLDGYRFACGLAARATVADAARAAILELCQMELAILLAEIKLAHAGEQGLNAVDRSHLERARRIDVSRCELLHATGCPLAHQMHIARSPFLAVAEALAHAEIETALVELTRPDVGIPVVRAFAPALQPMPSKGVTNRLRNALTHSDADSARYTQNVELVV